MRRKLDMESYATAHERSEVGHRGGCVGTQPVAGLGSDNLITSAPTVTNDLRGAQQSDGPITRPGPVNVSHATSDAELETLLGPAQQPSAIATAPLDEPDGYRDGGDHGDAEQDGRL